MATTTCRPPREGAKNKGADGTFIARLEQLEARVQQLEAVNLSRCERFTSHARDTDLALLGSLADATGGRDFTARELLRFAREVPALAQALAAALIDTPTHLGAWLRRVRGRHATVVVERITREGAGRRWAVSRCR